MMLEQNKPENNKAQERVNASPAKSLLKKYDAESVYEKITRVTGGDRDILDNALNLAGLDFDQIESMVFDKESGFNEERGTKISSLLADLKFHTDRKSKEGIARDLVHCLEGKVLQ